MEDFQKKKKRKYTSRVLISPTELSEAITLRSKSITEAFPK